MCLRPIKIRVRSKVLDMQGGQSYYITVPCGHCSECLSRKRDEWYFRSYYEARTTIENGGYVYFDTLTYSDDEVPHITDVIDVDKLNEMFGISPQSFGTCDYMCFSRQDLTDFFKRLRRRLDYHGYKSSECFKYFLTSEYGTSERGTHRPHYHVLFFVNDPNLDPIDFSHYVYDCWQHGRTDGIDYHGREYVMNHTYGGRFSADMLACQKACSYVAKYITKDSHFERVIKHRIRRIMDKIFSYKWCKLHGIEFKKGLWYSHMMNNTDFVRVWREVIKSELEPGREYVSSVPSAEQDFAWDEYVPTEPSVVVPFESESEFDEFWSRYSAIKNDFDELDTLQLFDEEIVRSEVIISGAEIKKLYELLVRHLSQFHLQSKGFGASFLDYNDYADVMSEGIIKIPDAKKGVKFIPLPRYYQMRIFYNLHRDFNNHLSYTLNDEGKAFKLLRLNQAVDTLSLKFAEWQLNMLWRDYYNDNKDAAEWYDKLINRFIYLNKNRDFSDFAKYLLFYKGRIKSKAQLERERQGIFVVDEIPSFVNRFFNDITVHSDVLYNYATPTDKELGLNGITANWYGDAESWNAGDLIPERFYGCESWLFEQEYVMDDKCDPKFEHYDEMFDIYCRAQEYRVKFKQQSFDAKEDLQRRLKNALKLKS